ncbi:hypothetical protein KCU81_g265, partial [Aureobasidium melanogenum]
MKTGTESRTRAVSSTLEDDGDNLESQMIVLSMDMSLLLYSIMRFGRGHSALRCSRECKYPQGILYSTMRSMSSSGAQLSKPEARGQARFRQTQQHCLHWEQSRHPNSHPSQRQALRLSFSGVPCFHDEHQDGVQSHEERHVPHDGDCASGDLYRQGERSDRRCARVASRAGGFLDIQVDGLAHGILAVELAAGASGEVFTRVYDVCNSLRAVMAVVKKAMGLVLCRSDRCASL